jgi:hypothetical protein
MSTPRGKYGWFADVADEEDQVEGAIWMPFLQVPGACIPLRALFATKNGCERFIRREVLNAGMLPWAP